ncbi:TetR/AcrR family transcriptional regulator [Oscillibacter sp.]|uniref:TetR/AcrR family transcriptional regulator n=1 Tax=Oscillibacter sp. TaxID=1945593 RepID=UPI00289B7A0A|nr:TetR/AcrR family transcriptional regulator [Oscillibacter sp.]
MNKVEKGEDRRSRRSQKLLKKGLLELMLEKRFSAISVRDVTERADMNRGTFYLHYPDTTALLQSVETDMLAEAQLLIDEHIAEFEAGGSLRPVFKPILDYIVKHRPEFEALFANNSTSNFTDRLQELIHRNGVSLVRAKFHTASSAQMDFLISFIGYGLIGLIKTWFDQDMVLPREDLVRQADRLVNGAAMGILSDAGEFKKNETPHIGAETGENV